MGMHFLSTSHNCGYVNNLKNRYCLIQLSKTQFLWAVGNTLYQLNEIQKKQTRLSEPCLLLYYPEFGWIWVTWLCLVNNKTCSGWSYLLDPDARGASRDGSSQSKWIFSSPGAGLGAEREVEVPGGTDGPRPCPTGWLCPIFESTWAMQSSGAVAWASVLEKECECKPQTGSTELLLTPH